MAKPAGVWGHWNISSLYSFALSFCFYLPSSPGGSPFCAQPLAVLPLCCSPPPIPRTSPYIPVHPAAASSASKYSAAGCGLPTQKEKGTVETFPPAFPFSIAIGKLAAHKGAAGPRNQTPARRAGALALAQTQLIVIPCCLLCLYSTGLLGLQDTLKISPSPITCLLHKMSTDVSLLVCRRAAVNNL